MNVTDVRERIDELLARRPEGVDALDMVSEMKQRGFGGDDVAAAIADGVQYGHYVVDYDFRVHDSKRTKVTAYAQGW